MEKQGYNFFINGGIPQQIDFESEKVMYTAGLNVVKAIKDIHIKGMLYGNICLESFGINLKNGNIVMIGKDELQGSITRGSSVCSEYTAPEIAEAGKENDFCAERYSMAVVLYRLFCADGPEICEGWAIKNKGDCWNTLPEDIRSLFIRTFSEGFRKPLLRASERQWMKVLEEAVSNASGGNKSSKSVSKSAQNPFPEPNPEFDPEKQVCVMEPIYGPGPEDIGNDPGLW